MPGRQPEGADAADAADAPLAGLRAQIDEVDAQIVDLLARRLDLVGQVGELKGRHGLPIYAPERESAMIEAKREMAAARGVPPDLVEDVLRRCMREAYAHEKNMGFTKRAPDLGPVVVVGGGGRMGSLFGRMLRLSGYDVRVVERDDTPEQVAGAVADAGMVVVSVPIHDTVGVIRSLPTLPPDCLLVDLTSTKKAAVEAMLEVHPGPVLGLHPMFGPDVDSLAKQVVAVVPGRDPEASHWLVEQIALWGARVHEISAQDHDDLMGLIQALRTGRSSSPASARSATGSARTRSRSWPSRATSSRTPTPPGEAPLTRRAVPARRFALAGEDPVGRLCP